MPDLKPDSKIQLSISLQQLMPSSTIDRFIDVSFKLDDAETEVITKPLWFHNDLKKLHEVLDQIDKKKK
jgi:hypothetical protein